MGFALWIDEDEQLAWAQGTHEYRPYGAAVIGSRGQFRWNDFRQSRRVPRSLRRQFVGFFGSLETVNECLDRGGKRTTRLTPGHLL